MKSNNNTRCEHKHLRKQIHRQVDIGYQTCRPRRRSALGGADPKVDLKVSPLCLRNYGHFCEEHAPTARGLVHMRKVVNDYYAGHTAPLAWW